MSFHKVTEGAGNFPVERVKSPRPGKGCVAWEAPPGSPPGVLLGLLGPRRGCQSLWTLSCMLAPGRLCPSNWANGRPLRLPWEGPVPLREPGKPVAGDRGDPLGRNPPRSQAPGWPSCPPAHSAEPDTAWYTGCMALEQWAVPKATQEGGEARQNPLSAGFWGRRIERLDAGLLPKQSWVGPRDLQAGLIPSSPWVRGSLGAGNFPGGGEAELSPDDGRLPPRRAGRGPGFLPPPPAPPRALLGWGTRGGRARLGPHPCRWRARNTPLRPHHPPPRGSVGRVSGTGRGRPHGMVL